MIVKNHAKVAEEDSKLVAPHGWQIRFVYDSVSVINTTDV
jgi:hypothetical protein